MLSHAKATMGMIDSFCVTAKIQDWEKFKIESSESTSHVIPASVLECPKLSPWL